MKFRKKNGIFFKTLIWIWLGLLAASQIVNLITCWLIGSQWDTLPTDWLVAHNLLTRTLVILDICKRYILWWKSVARHCWFPLITAIFLKWEHLAVLYISKFFIQGGCTCALSPHPFMYEVLSERRQLMKWVGIFQGEFDGWKFSRWGFSRGKFS